MILNTKIKTMTIINIPYYADDTVENTDGLGQDYIIYVGVEVWFIIIELPTQTSERSKWT